MIGIFDSGLGGLTVVKELLVQIPQINFTYFGDTARMPYGPKGPHVIGRYAEQNARFLIDQGAQVILIACNTASAFAGDTLKATCPVPVFDVIGPAIAEASRVTRGTVGVIGTRGTIASGIYTRSMAEKAPDVLVYAQACPLLVPLVEEDWHETKEAYRIAETYLTPLLERNIDTLILGCTHYPFMMQTFRALVGPKVTIIDPAVETVRYLKKWLATHPAVHLSTHQNPIHRYIVSDASGPFASIAKRWLSENLVLNEARIDD